MNSQPVHTIQTLRHWTIDRREFVGGSQRPAPVLPYSEQAEGSPFLRLASKLAKVKSDLVRRVR